MKRVLIAVSIFLAGASASHAYPDIIDNERPAVWRSSQSCGPIAWATIATGTIIVHAVSVDSATVNQSASRIVTFNSTTTPIPQNAANFLTTGTLTIPNVMGNAGMLGYPPYEYNAYFSSGVVVSKVGASCTTIWWDYRNSGNANKPFYQLNYPWNP